MGLMRVLCRPIVAGSLLLTLVGCAAPPPPFQAMKSPTDLGYGYKEDKIDASHYTVIYVGDRAQTAENYLERRAAQVSRAAGFAYFSFDKRGVEILRKTETDLQRPENVRRTDAGVASVNDFIPDDRRKSVATYYYAWGQIALLSAAQAQADPKALQVSTVLGSATP